MIKKTLLLTLIFVFSITPCFAASYDSVTISGKHVIEKKEDISSFNNTFILKGEGQANMPEGSNANEKKVVVPANKSFNFGEIKFDSPGVHEYIVKREVQKSKDIKQDNSVYHVKVAVFSDGTNAIVYQKEGKKAKSEEIKYKDTYSNYDKATKNTKNENNSTNEQQGTSKQTGDGFNIASLGILAVLFLILLVAKRKRND